jgi:hypothetical protein
MMRRWLKILTLDALIMIVTFGAIQLIPVPRENPPVRREPVWNSAETRTLAAQACFDCHSSETAWPWYAKIAPFSWVVWYDVTEGRQALDFSDWDRHVDDDQVDPDDPFPPKTLSERIEERIRNNTMPPGTYRLAHPDARLSDAEKETLIAGLLETVKQNQEP